MHKVYAGSGVSRICERGRTSIGPIRLLSCGDKNSEKKRDIKSPKLHGQAKGGGRTTPPPKYATVRRRDQFS
jgi:hypothetical protein